MGEKSHYKTIIFLLSLVFSLSLLAFFISAANKCCVTQNPITCSDISMDSECVAGVINNQACSQISECAEGCCCELGVNAKFVSSGECQAYGYSLNITGSNLDNSACEQHCSGQNIIYQDCQYNSCSQVNSNKCYCGGSLVNSGTFCCKDDSASFVTQAQCLQSLSCKPPTLYKISGIVKEQPNNLLSGVSFIAAGRTSYSDNNGAFTINNIPAGTGKITVSKQGYVTQYVDYDTTGGDHTGHNIILIPTSQPENCIFTSSTGTWDDDKDGCMARYDSSCWDASYYESEGYRGLCSDKVDNDCDGNFDCNDNDCVNDPFCSQQTKHDYCGDGNVTQPNFFGVWEECEEDSQCAVGEVCQNCKCISILSSNCGNGEIDAGESCDPQASDTNPLWTCDRTTQTCDPVSCSCIQIEGDCGNGMVDADEQCDYSGANIAPRSYCSFNQCIKEGNPGECQCRVQSTCGDGIVDRGEQCDGFQASSCSSGQCDPGTCRCSDCSFGSKTPILSISDNANNITLIWGVSCSKETPVFYEINRCYSNTTTNCLPTFYKTSTQTQYMESINQGYSYCYTVSAVYHDGNFTSNKACTDVPVNNCPPGDPRDYWCDKDNDFVMKCDKNNIVIEDNCETKGGVNAKYTCIDYPFSTFPDQNAKCEYQSYCELCNGWFSMYSSVYGHRANYSSGGQIFEEYCSSIPSCYLDYTKTSVDKFYECLNVESCYDYKSQESCVQNQCNQGESQGCVWNPSTRYSELGIGVCKPADKKLEDCSRCEGVSLNKFFGACSDDICQLLGECWYDDPSVRSNNNGVDYLALDKPCIHKRETVCQYYDNEEDCIGYGSPPTNSSLLNSWKNTQTPYPYQGTNEHVAISNDYFGFGKCVWGEYKLKHGTACFKDGDGSYMPDCTGANFNYRCMSDLNPPVSTISYVNPVKKDLSIKFSVIDDISSLGNKFHFGIVSSGPCYPQINDSQKTITLGQDEKSGSVSYPMSSSGTYTFCYFAEDSHGNFEEVKSVQLDVDAGLPQVTYEKIEAPFEMPWKGDFVWYTDLTLRGKLYENATCDIWLTKTNDTSYVGGIKKINAMGDFFELKYPIIEDGDYIFHAECIDSAGNTNTPDNRTYEFRLDADKHITDLIPHSVLGPRDEVNGKINIILSAKTMDDAECRFHANPSVAYDDMTIFEDTNDVNHYHTLIYPDDFTNPGLERYKVRCNFTAKNKVYGNSGDNILFAIDYDKPITNMIDSEGNIVPVDNVTWYRSSFFDDIYLNCRDIMIPENNFMPGSKDWAAGCDEVQYSFQRYSLSPISRGNASASFKDELINGPNILLYRSKDNVDNLEYTKSVNIHIDDEDFDFSFTIWKFDEFNNRINVNTLTWGEVYYVDIIASKRTPDYVNNIYSYSINISNADTYLMIGGKPYYFTNNNTVSRIEIPDLPPSENRSHQWIATLVLPAGDPNLRNLDGTATGQFYIKAQDSHGIISTAISSGNPVYIDTTPPQAPVFDPAFEEGVLNNYEQYYEDIFNAYNGSYYTNDKNLFVTGKTVDIGKVYFFVNNMIYSLTFYDQSQNAAPGELTFLPVFEDALDGTNKLTFKEDVSMFYNVGRFLNIEGDERTEYAHYHEYYTINKTTVLLGNPDDKTEVYLASNLEYPVDELTEDVYVYDARYPYDWFGVALSLDEGWNTLKAQMRDTTDNDAETDKYNVFYDKYPPNMSVPTPQNGVVIAEASTPVMISIDEWGAGLEEDTISMKINGEEVSVDISYVETPFYVPGGNKISIFNYNISYQDPDGFEDGVYNVLFEAKELAARKLTKAWRFTIDTSAPKNPDFELVGIDKDEQYLEELDTWFTNHVTDFTLKFPDTAPVVIESIDLKTVDSEGVDLPKRNNAANCTGDNDNLFTCSFIIPSDFISANDFDEYALKIKAYKILNDSISPSGTWYKRFIIDKVPPQYTLYFDNTTNSNANLTFEASVSTQEKRLKAYIIIEGEKVDLVPINGSSGFDMRYLWNKPFGFEWNVRDSESKKYNLTFYLSDYAGNFRSTDDQIIIDNVRPQINIVNISSHPIWISKMQGLSPYSKNADEFIELDEGLENARFGGNALNIVGTIYPNTDIDDNSYYDIQRIEVSKRSKNGELFNNNEGPLNVPMLSGCSATNNVCYYEDKFYIKDFVLSGEIGREIPNYLLFEVEDQAENIAYYTLILVSDQKKPNEPIIEIN